MTQVRSDRDEAYASVWNAVRGGIRDFRNAHPDEIMPSGNREASLVKRIVGQIESLAERWCGDAPTEPGVTASGRQPGNPNLGSGGGAYGEGPAAQEQNETGNRRNTVSQQPVTESGEGS